MQSMTAVDSLQSLHSLRRPRATYGPLGFLHDLDEAELRALSVVTLEGDLTIPHPGSLPRSVVTVMACPVVNPTSPLCFAPITPPSWLPPVLRSRLMPFILSSSSSTSTSVSAVQQRDGECFVSLHPMQLPVAALVLYTSADLAAVQVQWPALDLTASTIPCALLVTSKALYFVLLSPLSYQPPCHRTMWRVPWGSVRACQLVPHMDVEMIGHLRAPQLRQLRDHVGTQAHASSTTALTTPALLLWLRRPATGGGNGAGSSGGSASNDGAEGLSNSSTNPASRRARLTIAVCLPNLSTGMDILTSIPGNPSQ